MKDALSLSLFMYVLCLVFTGCKDSKGYLEVGAANFSDIISLHSAPSFKGYFYDGSDVDYH